MEKLNDNYFGGFVVYIYNVRKLFVDFKVGRNFFDGYILLVSKRFFLLSLGFNVFFVCLVFLRSLVEIGIGLKSSYW